MSALEIIILAAGQGTRMKSSLPKVLHRIGEKPMLERVYDTAKRLDPKQIHIVYGHGGEQVKATLAHLDANWVEQDQQLGTGHAVDQALPAVDDGSTVLVLYGDVPLMQSSTLETLVAEAHDKGLALLTVALDDPAGYGRILRDDQGRIQCIVEEKDASPEQKRIAEGNTGVLAAHAARLKGWLSRLDNNNAQGEYYLTDIFAMAVDDGMEIHSAMPETVEEVMGVNDRVQLAYLERVYQRQQAETLMRAGVTLADPARFDLRGELNVGQDVYIDVGVVIEGRVSLGNGVKVGANCVIKQSRIGDGVEILPMSVIEQAQIEKNCVIGPFARLRPGTHLHEGAKAGNFVEIKKSEIGAGSKVNHLSYIGDTTMGMDVNIGAGTITCNYDGANKFRTEIGDKAFIGSDSQLVAPVVVKSGATIGAGSTITKDAPEEKLTLSRSKQVTIKNWKRPVKQTQK